MNKKFSRFGTIAIAGTVALGVVGTTTAPSFAIGGEEGTLHGQVTPGTAVWGMSQNDYLGEFKVPTTDGLDKALYLDASAQNPRTQFNTLVKYDGKSKLTTDTMVGGQKVSADGLKKIVTSLSLARNIDDSKELTDDVKSLLKSYGYNGDFGQKWGLAAQNLTEKIPQIAEDGTAGQKITVTQGDYVMMALSANAMNGGNPESFPTPVPTASITGNYDEGQSAGMTSDFNDLVSALQKASAAVSDDAVNAASVQVLTYQGNDPKDDGNPSYRRGLSIAQSTLLNVSDIPKGQQNQPKVTDNTSPSATASPSSTTYDPSGQNDAKAQDTAAKKNAAEQQAKDDATNKKVDDDKVRAEAKKKAENKDDAAKKQAAAMKNSKDAKPRHASSGTPSSSASSVPSSSSSSSPSTPTSSSSGVDDTMTPASNTTSTDTTPSTQNLDTGKTAGAEQVTNQTVLASIFGGVLLSIIALATMGIRKFRSNEPNREN